MGTLQKCITNQQLLVFYQIIYCFVSYHNPFWEFVSMSMSISSARIVKMLWRSAYYLTLVASPFIKQTHIGSFFNIKIMHRGIWGLISKH